MEHVHSLLPFQADSVIQEVPLPPAQIRNIWHWELQRGEPCRADEMLLVWLYLLVLGQVTAGAVQLRRERAEAEGVSSH